MATMLKFLPGSTIRWRATRFIVVDYADIDGIIARELGKRKLERIPVRDAKPDRTPGDQKALDARKRARALSGFVSPGGSCVRQTVIRGSLGTLVL